MRVFSNHGHFTRDSSSGVATTKRRATLCQMALHAKRSTADNSNFHTSQMLHVKMDNGAHFQNVSRAALLPKALLVSTETLSLLCTVRENNSLKNIQATSLSNAEGTSVKGPAHIRVGIMTKMEPPSTHHDKDAEKSCVQVLLASRNPIFQKNTEISFR